MSISEGNEGGMNEICYEYCEIVVARGDSTAFDECIDECLADYS